MADVPNSAEFKEFLDSLYRYRETIPGKQQMMLDTMLATALGQKVRSDGEVRAYWVDVNPGVGVTPAVDVNPGVGTTVATYDTTPWVDTMRVW